MPKKTVLNCAGAHAELIDKWLEATGRYTIAPRTSAPLAKQLKAADAAVIACAPSGAPLSPEEAAAVAAYAKAGGAVIVIGTATAAYGRTPWNTMLGAEVIAHGPATPLTVTPMPSDNYTLARILPFQITDAPAAPDTAAPSDAEVLATFQWKGRILPLVYTRPHGNGRVVCIGLGATEDAWRHPEFMKIVTRAVDAALGRKQAKPLKAGVIGYGCSFHMGKLHLQSLRDSAGFEPVAICDLVEKRREEGLADFPGIATYSSYKKMLDKADVDLVVIITEHHTHAKLAIDVLNAGRHVVTEKPFCITVTEADAMIAAAKKNRRMLSVFHNRRWDGDYLAIRNAIAEGMLGDVFQIEAAMSAYQHPGYWWRSDKRISGGAFYDWGAHIVDWVLGLANDRIAEVSGHFQHKRVWHDVTNEDHCSTVIRFQNGASAHVELSHLAALTKPRWRILGTQGALLNKSYDSEVLKIATLQNGARTEIKRAYCKSDWHAYYRNVADHLLLGEPLAVTPESARRVIAVIETAEKSSRAGKALPFPKQCA